MKMLGFMFLFLSLSASGDELRLHFLKSPLGVNWSTPWTLAHSIIQNQVVPFTRKRAYSISHVFVELKCDSVKRHIFRGMTSATTTEERDLVFKEHYGFGTMFHFFKGRLEKEDTILEDLIPYEGKKRKSDLTIKVSGESCQRMLDYADEYERLGYGEIYAGLQGDPLKREGSGCSAFAVSFLRVGGLMDDFTNEWQRIIDVPKKYIGGPLTGNDVRIWKLLSRPFARWSNKGPHIHLEAWDPELMHSWVRKTYFEVKNGTYKGRWPVHVARKKNTFKVKLDMENRDTPEGEFWIGHVP